MLLQVIIALPISVISANFKKNFFVRKSHGPQQHLSLEPAVASLVARWTGLFSSDR